VKGLKLEIIKHEGKTPFIFGFVDSTIPNDTKSILMYGHFDKQPHLLPWRDGLSPIDPVIENGKLYGRGGADDGYAFFTTIILLKVLQSLGIPHNKIILTFEGDEESGTGDLEYYMDTLLD
jgi:acetylornithine deacetylase/succinyl-diaminopimelate desuccinylase-like protein